MAELATPPERAASEWLVGTDRATRCFATPERVADALGLAEVPLQQHTLAARSVAAADSAVSGGAGTQVLLRKTDAGEYRLLLDGCVSTAVGAVGDIGEIHTVPRFALEDAIEEDATRRKVPAPLLVGLLLEDGACAPERVEVEIVQRTHINGAQVDKGREPVVARTTLAPTSPADVRAPVVVAPYPMRFTRPPYVTFVDRHKEREAKLAENGNTWTRLYDALRTGRFFGLFARYFPSTAGIGLGTLSIFTGLTASGGAAIAFAGLREVSYALASLYAQYSIPPDQRGTRTKAVDINVPLTGLEALLYRMTGFDSGGRWSDQGRAWTVKTLQEARRYQDAVVLEYFMYASEAAGPAADRAATIERIAQLGNVTQAELDTLSANLELVHDNLVQNVFTVDGLQRAYLEADGFVDFAVRVTVFDAALPGSARTFLLESDVAFEAGWVAAGYYDAVQRLPAAIAEVTDVLSRKSTRLQRSPILAGMVLTGNLQDDVLRCAPPPPAACPPLARRCPSNPALPPRCAYRPRRIPPSQLSRQPRPLPRAIQGRDKRHSRGDQGGRAARERRAPRTGGRAPPPAHCRDQRRGAADCRAV